LRFLAWLGGFTRTVLIVVGCLLVTIVVALGIDGMVQSSRAHELEILGLENQHEMDMQGMRLEAESAAQVNKTFVDFTKWNSIRAVMEAFAKAWAGEDELLEKLRRA